MEEQREEASEAKTDSISIPSLGFITDNIRVYDIEVVRGPNEVKNGWENPEAMGLAIAICYDYHLDKYIFYEQAERGRTRLIQHLGGMYVVSFNGVKFDSKILLGNDRLVKCEDGFPVTRPMNGMEKWMNIDLLLLAIQGKYGLDTAEEAYSRSRHRSIHDGSLSLDGIARGTLGKAKTGLGAKAPLLFNRGLFGELYAYCLEDVRLTRQLFEFAVRNGYLVDRKGTRIDIAGHLEKMITSLSEASYRRKAKLAEEEA